MKSEDLGMRDLFVLFVKHTVALFTLGYVVSFTWLFLLQLMDVEPWGWENYIFVDQWSLLGAR